jgi:hypothetical protein
MKRILEVTMLASPYRLAGHAVSAVLLAGVAVVATGAGAGAAGKAANRPDSYGGNAVAASMEFRVDKQPFPFPVTDPFHSWVPYAGTSIDSSGGDEAIASSIYPGQGALGAPALICVFAPPLCAALPGGGPPKYPDWAHAQYPTHKDDTATLAQKPFPGSGPFELTPNQVVAHADTDRVEATAAAGSAGLSGVITAQQASSHSLQTFQGDTLVLTAESVLKGVEIGGQLHIDEIRSTATAKINGTDVGVSSASTTMSGASVAGQGVTIDSSGIHLAGKGDNGLVKQTVNSALAKLASNGISVTSLPVTKSAKTRGVAAEAGGLLLTATQQINGPGVGPLGQTAHGTYKIIATVGGAGVNAFAAPGSPFNLGTTAAPPPVTGKSNPAAASATGNTSLPSAPQTQTTSPTGQPAVVAGPAPKEAALPTDLTNKKLETLALVLLGYPLLMLLGAPLRAPARLPRAR